MILENSRNDVQTIGEVQENQVGIDLKNLDHIITLLSSNLYSNPEASFLRETVCNGIDSHIEAGTKEPVIVSFIEDNNYQNFISVRDYGTGLSPERFKEVYLNVGSSTKRQSNDYIGAFGIRNSSKFFINLVA